MNLNRILFLGNNNSSNQDSIKSLSISINKNSQYQFGHVEFGNNFQLQLINVPNEHSIIKLNQEEDISNLGFVLIIDNNLTNYLKYLVTTLSKFKSCFSSTGFAVGVIKNKSVVGQLNLINKRIRDLDLKAPVFEIEPNSKQDIALLIQALLISKDHYISTLQ